MQELEKVTTVDVQSAIDQIVAADRQLALKQLTRRHPRWAAMPVESPKRKGNLADAAATCANGDFAKAVLDYKKAWQNAVKAQ